MTGGFEQFITAFKQGLHKIFHEDNNINELSLNRGLPDSVWKDIMAFKPLSVAIPEAYGGRGAKVKECLGVLAAASYEALPLSLTFGINIALFIEPLAKYGSEEVKPQVFDRFLHHAAMGGLMITEPDFGSDALNMQTSCVEEANSYHIKGQKHWQGLTGMADYWLVTARPQLENGSLARDINFFMTDNRIQAQHIKVEHYFNNLGLYMIPYGLNTLDLHVPKNQRLIPESTGIKMMLDILHRSRLQFPGMGMGFLHRMLDEALAHCQSRIVGAGPLIELDAVKYQLSRIQSSYTICSAMCARSTEISGIEHDVSAAGWEANSMKALVTDLMQEAAQMGVQLAGSSGYRLEHIAARGIVDSRPFQIFEGSNEMLYTQIADQVGKLMKKQKETNFGTFLSAHPLCNLVIDEIRQHLNFDLSGSLKQRELIAIGRIVARLTCLQYVANLVSKGFREDLFEQSKKHMHEDVLKLLAELTYQNDAMPIVDYRENSNWLSFV